MPRSPRRTAGFVRILILISILVGVGLWAAHWARSAMVRVHETDARIAVDMVAVSSRLDGWVVERPVKEGSHVERGDTLAVIDGREAQTWLTELLAELERIEAERAELLAQIAMVDERTRSRTQSEQAGLEAAQALVQAIQHEYEYAEREFHRAEKLAESKVVSAKALDEARTAFLRAQKDLLRARAGVSTARAQLAEARAGRREIDVLQSERRTLEFQKEEVLARIERQRLEVADRVIESPASGVISRAFVEVGEFVQPGQRIVLLHDPRAVYVEANVRETEIRRVKVGQAVRVEVDAYPDELFEGRVELIGEAATSQFALLPSPNPSGHFTKVTQRIPVRIAVAQREGLLRPGMMVEVFIDVRGG